MNCIQSNGKKVTKPPKDSAGSQTSGLPIAGRVRKPPPPKILPFGGVVTFIPFDRDKLTVPTEWNKGYKAFTLFDNNKIIGNNRIFSIVLFMMIA